MTFLRTLTVNLLVFVILLVVGLVLTEGVTALFRYDQPATSLLYRANLALTGGVRSSPAEADGEGGKKNGQNPSAKFLESQAFMSNSCIVSISQFEEMLPHARACGMLFGNTPFRELATDPARVTHSVPGLGKCTRPNLNLETGFLRSMVFDADNPPTFSVPAGRTLPEELAGFIRRYGFGRFQLKTDSNGDRITVPDSMDHDIVAIVGDSVAFGVMLPDDKTLASWLQQNRPGVRYLNCGVPGCTAKENLLRLDDRLMRYGDRIRGVVYVLCENDLGEGKDWGDDVVDRLADRLDAHNIQYRVFIYSQFMTRTMPEILRDKGNSLKAFANRRRIIDEAQSRSFTVIDWSSIVHDYQKSSGSLFAGFALLVDHAHWSAAGVEQVGKRIPPFKTTP